MRWFMLLCGLFVASVMEAQTDGWRIALKPDFTRSFYDVYFIDANTGWIVGDSGMVIKTTNGGINWNDQNTGTNIRIRKIYFLNQNLGWAAAERRTVLRTTNGGDTWTQVQLPTPGGSDTARITYSIYFINGQKGWTVSGRSTSSDIYVSNDSGKTWTSQKNLPKPLYDIHFATPTRGIAVGNDFSQLQYTTDGGTTWTTTAITDFGGTTTYTSTTLNAAVMLDSTTVVTVGWGSFFNTQPTMTYRSTDGGKTYVFQTQPTNKRTLLQAGDVYFKDKNNAILVGRGRGGFISKTTDGGVTWTPLPAMFGHALYGVSGVGDKVWIVGINGFIGYSPDFGGTWQTLTKHHTESVRSMSFVTAQTGFLMTFNGTIRKTTNGGQDWKTVSQLVAGPVIDAVDAAQFVSENVGYAGQEYGQIAKTTDGGVTWTTIMAADSNFQSATRAVSILNENTGFFARSKNAYDSDQFAKTISGGSSFTTRDTATKKQPRSIAFYDANRGFIGAGSGILRGTSDGGTTWFAPTLSGNPVGVPKTGDISGFCIVDSANAWLVGSKMFYKSTDLGKTWNYVAHSGVTVDSLFYSIAFSGKTGYAVGYTGLMVKTTDGGATWKQITDIPSTQLLYYVTFDKSGNAWASSATGYVYTTAPLTFVRSSGGTIPEGYVLDQNYPNPFNPATSISFHIPMRSDVNITVYDILGREVATLVNNNLAQGNYTVPFDGSKYASGVYWYSLRSNAFASTKKMILVK